MNDLSRVPAGTPVVVGERLVPMPQVGATDRVIAVARAGEILVVPAEAYAAAEMAVSAAHAALAALAAAPAERVSDFFRGFARELGTDRTWDAIAEANRLDVEDAERRGRSTTRLRVSAKMRADMIAGLEGWAATPSRIGEVIERREADGYVLERRRAPLGVVAFVFEGRPNVFADGVGVLRNGNAAVMRIGGDALRTATAIEAHALAPALRAAGLPADAVRLVQSRAQAAGLALFTMPRVRLAIARGSGKAVALLGAIAEQHGIPASLHGTGGAWLYVEPSASPEAVENAITLSLDRKVCNTLNVLLLDRAAAAELGPVCARALARVRATVHVTRGSEGVVEGILGFEIG